jgi:hypothetical protein
MTWPRLPCPPSLHQSEQVKAEVAAMGVIRAKSSFPNFITCDFCFRKKGVRKTRANSEKRIKGDRAPHTNEGHEAHSRDLSLLVILL